MFAQLNKWGWNTHKYINEHAVDYLPAEMAVFKEHRDYLREHAIDPDTDDLPGYFHYIDIDYYPEFFSGTLPHDIDSLISLYNLSIVQDKGVVPWVIEGLTDSLTILMSAGDWDNVWQTAAELGHYVADAHQPLHLTVNYNGQFSGNNGIHSRYETSMMNTYLSQIPLPEEQGKYWTNVIDSVFSFIEYVYPYVDSIIAADDIATAGDDSYGSTYYSIMWEELEPLTTICVQKAILDLASLWQTAWENAGRPLPVSVDEDNKVVVKYYLAEAYPNPFNPETNIEFSIPEKVFVSLKIYSTIGREVATLVSGELSRGMYKYSWNASGFASGIYFFTLETSRGFVQTKKLVLLK
jgi:hypothetical protein